MIIHLDGDFMEQCALEARRAGDRATIEAQRAIDVANQTREEFLARMSHRLRTSLTAVDGRD